MQRSVVYSLHETVRLEWTQKPYFHVSEDKVYIL